MGKEKLCCDRPSEVVYSREGRAAGKSCEAWGRGMGCLMNADGLRRSVSERGAQETMRNMMLSCSGELFLLLWCHFQRGKCCIFHGI